MENVSAVTIWAITGNDQNQWYYYLLMISSTAPFFIGIIFMMIYYKFFHPHTTDRVYTPQPCTNNVNTSIQDVLG